jgi:hypothetical protein
MPNLSPLTPPSLSAFGGRWVGMMLRLAIVGLTTWPVATHAELVAGPRRQRRSALAANTGMGHDRPAVCLERTSHHHARWKAIVALKMDAKRRTLCSLLSSPRRGPGLRTSSCRPHAGAAECALGVHAEPIGCDGEHVRPFPGNHGARAGSRASLAATVRVATEFRRLATSSRSRMTPISPPIL